MNRLTTPILTATLVALMGISARATTISFGNYTLLPNTNSNPALPVLITNGNEANVSNANLWVEIGDGGPELTQLSAPAGTDAPGFEHLPGDVNLTGAGTFFSGDNTGSHDITGFPNGSLPQLAGYGVSTNANQFLNDQTTSVLAYLHFDTTGFTSGTWPVYLDDTVAGGNDFTDLGTGVNATPVHANLVAGMITIEPAPEPATLSLVVLGAIPVLAWAARKRVAKLSRRSD